ncbi:hypothetical protein BSL78_20764 [Apostichopus japonicus]|uniref:Fatty acid hydroxylase domain-containing protein n=1 Tax=Stichopus japonicus TaxID=307972 RepID=A0A2G8K321_STIJA|nr:hypothetical protein BSL78_20764 [Apostichopus japonicus]
MDVVLDILDDFVFTPYLYPTSWQTSYWLRQFISLVIIVYVGATVLYFGTASLCYALLFDKRLMEHPRFLKNQIRREIKWSIMSMPLMNIPTAWMFYLHHRGYGKTYHGVSSNTWLGYFSLPVEFVLVVLFTDMMIYWIHRAFHHRLLYSAIHKPHHAFKVPSPFASHAFHPIDGFMQSFPYHLFPFIFPLNKYLYVMFFVMVNFWTVSIHDGECKVPDVLKPVINGSAHHTDHHLFYNYNYGQFFTFWDRIAGSYRNPSIFTNAGPLDAVIEKKLSTNQNKTAEDVDSVSPPDWTTTVKRKGESLRLAAS